MLVPVRLATVQSVRIDRQHFYLGTECMRLRVPRVLADLPVARPDEISIRSTCLPTLAG